jgi:pimeloyl-ACP methyl ester carboxylesterase
VKLEIISKHPPGRGRATPVLFIHGMLCTASCWDAHFLDYFAQHGYDSYALNLRGHGASEGRERLAGTRIAEFVEDVACAVRQLPAAPALIGHSMGGFITQKYLEKHDSPAAVLLSSPAPSGMLPTALRKTLRHPLVLARVALSRSLRPFIATPGLAREAFFSGDLPEEELAEYWRQMQDDSFMAFLDMLALDLPKPGNGTTPVLVVGAGRDAMIAPGEIRATARAFRTTEVIVPDVAHNSMLELRWQSVADEILSWLDDRLE